MKANLEMKVYASIADRPQERAVKPCYRQVIYGIDVESFDFASVIKATHQLYPQLNPHVIFEITELT